MVNAIHFRAGQKSKAPADHRRYTNSPVQSDLLEKADEGEIWAPFTCQAVGIVNQLLFTVL